MQFEERLVTDAICPTSPDYLICFPSPKHLSEKENMGGELPFLRNDWGVWFRGVVDAKS